MSLSGPGVCLTFDDLFVDNWCDARAVFDAHDARATFCVCMLHTATPKQVAGLRTLQSDGHEIGYHSRTHPRLQPYLRRHGIERWLAEEIDAGVAEHRALGFPATSFASPFHASTQDTRRETGRRFKVVRVKGPRGVTSERLGARVFRAPARNNVVHNIGSVDFQNGLADSWDWLDEVLEAIKSGNGVGVFTGHNIRAVDHGHGRYSTHDQIDRLLGAIKAKNMKFYTLTEFANMA